MKTKVLTVSLVCLMGAPVLGTRGPAADLEEDICGTQRQAQDSTIDDQFEAIGVEGAETLFEVWNALKPHLQKPTGMTMSFLIFAALLRCVTASSLEE